MAIRSRRVSKAEYKALLKAEREVAKKHDFTIKVRYVPFSWFRVKNFGTRSGVRGAFCKDKKIIRITIIGRPGRGKVLGVLYHEMRHLEHTVRGLFSDYYKISDVDIDSLCKSYSLTNIPDNIKLPSLRVAHLAELDCDRYAAKRLLPIGIMWPNKYPFKGTQAWNMLNHVMISYHNAIAHLELMMYTKAPTLDIVCYFNEIERVKRVLLNNGVDVMKDRLSQVAKLSFEIYLDEWYRGNA